MIQLAFVRSVVCFYSLDIYPASCRLFFGKTVPYFDGSLLFLVKYHTIHVIIKIGKISAPGTSSTNATNPTHPNIKKLTNIPATSRKSPNKGNNKIASIYSLTSRITQTLRNNNSISVKTKYLGTFFCWIVFKLFFSLNIILYFFQYFFCPLKAMSITIYIYYKISPFSAILL